MMTYGRARPVAVACVVARPVVGAGASKGPMTKCKGLRRTGEFITLNEVCNAVLTSRDVGMSGYDDDLDIHGYLHRAA
jgi:hypothetical protein